MSEHKMTEPVAPSYYGDPDTGFFVPATHEKKLGFDRRSYPLPLYLAETVQALQAEIERLRAERDALAQDAARLDWIGANGYAVRRRSNGKRNLVFWADTTVRAAVDRAMKESGQ